MSDQNVIKTEPNGDQKAPIRVQRPEARNNGRGRTTDLVDSPSPNPTQLEVWQLLLGGLHALSLNDFGRPWPYPRRDVIAQLVADHDEDLCVQAARETREIVQSQDRAPNITRLYEKKLTDLAEVRITVRGALAGEGSTCQ